MKIRPFSHSPSSNWLTSGLRNCLGIRHLKWVIPALLCLWISGMTVARAAANEITLEWDANTEPEVAGYKLHYGTATGSYARSVDAGNFTSVAVPDLISNFTYYFVVTAYDSHGIESPASNEVSYTVPPPPTLGVEYVARLGLPSPLPAFPEIRMHDHRPDGIFVFTVIGPARTAVTISVSPDLQTWHSLATVTNPTGGIKVSDLESPGHQHRFYRVKMVDMSGLQVPD